MRGGSERTLPSGDGICFKFLRHTCAVLRELSEFTRPDTPEVGYSVVDERAEEHREREKESTEEVGDQRHCTRNNYGNGRERLQMV